MCFRLLRKFGSDQYDSCECAWTNRSKRLFRQCRCICGSGYDRERLCDDCVCRRAVVFGRCTQPSFLSHSESRLCYENNKEYELRREPFKRSILHGDFRTSRALSLWPCTFAPAGRLGKGPKVPCCWLLLLPVSAAGCGRVALQGAIADSEFEDRRCGAWPRCFDADGRPPFH